MKKLFSLMFMSITLMGYSQLPSYVPTNGLKGFWPFCGNANDVSGNNNNGTVNGAILTTDRFNIPANSYQFNGTSDFISTTMTGVLGNNPRAVSFWARTTNSNSTMCGVSWGDEQSNPNYGVRWECAFNYANTGVTIIGSDCAITYSSPSPVNDNNWHHYVYQYNVGIDFTSVQVYQDAVLLSTVLSTHNSNAPINTSNNWSVNFGRIPYFIPHYFDGSIDEIGIWNRILNISEIQQLFMGNGRCNDIVNNINGVLLNQIQVDIYPNPNSGSFTIVGKESMQIKIVNTLGQIIIEKNINANNGIKIENLTPGIYFVIDKINNLRKKIVVN